MRSRSSSLFGDIDWITVLLYVVLVIMGWMNIYAAVYNEEHYAITDISQKYGKQMIWIAIAFTMAFLIIVMHESFFTVFAYAIFAFFLVANIAVPFLGREVKGSRSWFRFGDFGIQPAEFMKFATNLVLAKYLSNQGVKLTQVKNTLVALGILFVPMVVILKLQNETGLALVFFAFILSLYREGLSVNFLLVGFLLVLLFVLGLVVDNVYLYTIITLLCGSAFFFIKRNRNNMITIVSICIIACTIVRASTIAYDHLQQHQKVRIDVLLGRGEVDLRKEGYNVNQAKIAIGSGGLWGKGYLQGTQTKYNFVPEQDTDFIFCTVGEEWGFVGSATVILLQLALIMRVMFLAEGQRSVFTRIYAYGVASILFFHLTINVGMTIGLAPVIGIPLPFFSYGGSSLLSFTTLLFIFLKLDSRRLQVLR